MTDEQIRENLRQQEEPTAQGKKFYADEETAARAGKILPGFEAYELLTNIFPQLKDLHVCQLHLHIMPEGPATVNLEIYLEDPNKADSMPSKVWKKYNLVPVEENKDKSKKEG